MYQRMLYTVIFKEFTFFFYHMYEKIIAHFLIYIFYEKDDN